jgi:hypothetical protein
MRKFLNGAMVVIVFFILMGSCGGYENDALTTKQFLSISVLCLSYLFVSFKAKIN